MKVEKIIAQNEKVVIGTDVHTRKHVVTVKIGNDRYEKARHLFPDIEAWRNFLRRFPGCVIRVVYEAGPHGFNLRDQLGRIAEEEGADIAATILPPSKIPVEPGGKRVKTDKRDSRGLIDEYEKGKIEPVVAPPAEQREERQVVRTRESLKKMETELKNQIHGIIKYHGIRQPAGNSWTKHWTAELRRNVKEKDLTGHLAAVVETLLKLLDEIRLQVRALLERMDAILAEGRCGTTAKRLLGLTGVGKISALTIATEVADFGAFRNSEAFSSYTGLIPGERSSGDRVRRGRITRAGNARLRRVLVEAAWMWVRYDPEARKIFFKIMGGRQERKYIAIVAIARRLAVKAYHKAASPPAQAAA
jgi:transposase